MKRLIALLFVVLLVASACGSGDDTTTTGAPATTAGPTTTATDPPATTTTPTTTATPTTAPPTTTILPGEPIDIGPRAGDVIAVVGVAFDDTLNLRAAPGTDQAVLAELAPTYSQLVAQGEARQLPNSIWYKVEADGTIGWVSSRFVAFLGFTDDITSSIVAAVGEIPFEETMLDLADVVADQLESDEPASRVTVTVAPSLGDLGEVTIDIIGLGDDALFGWRVVIFGQPSESGDGFSLMAAEATALCGRGVTDDLLCV